MEELVFEEAVPDMTIASSLAEQGKRIVRSFRRGQFKVVLTVPEEWHEKRGVPVAANRNHRQHGGEQSDC